MGLGLLLCVAAEFLLRVLDLGRPTLVDDPFVGFSHIHPLFEIDEARGVHRIAPSRRKFFAYESFPIQKGTTTRRIFCLGGSTVKGEPYSIPTAFTTWLELALREAAPEHDWDVINCGGISYASYRLVPILQETLAYGPDLYILCTGHNEFLEDRTYGHLKDPQSLLEMTRRLTGGWRLLTLARMAVLALSGETATAPRDDRPLLGPETDPILDYHDSLAAYHWDDEWRRGVVAHYEYNLRRMASLARQAGVPVVFVLPPSNLGGCPPFKSEHPRPLSPEQQQRFDTLINAAREQYQHDIRRSIALLTEALQIDDRHAETLYDLGQCYRSIGQYAEARRWLVRARDCDVVPLRMISELEAAMRRVADDEGIPCLDAHALLEAQTPHGILDDALLVDHIHPGFDGHQLIAAALLELMEQAGWVQPRADWRERAQAAWQRHFESLDYTYFARGQRFLKSLEGWTQGRGDGPPAAQRFPWRIPAQEPVSPSEAPSREP